MKLQKNQSKNLGFIALAVVFILIIVALVMPTEQTREVSLSEVVQKTNEGQVEEVLVEGNKLTVTLKDQEEKLVSFKEDPAVSLTEYGINPNETNIVTKDPSDGGGRFFDIFLISFLPIILIMGFFYFMMRQAQSGSNQAMGFGKSKARVFGNDKEKINFSDVADTDEAKEELEEVVEFLKYPKKFQDLGARIPKGVLMVGAPGTGKTMLARAVAGEAKVPFFSISGSEFVEMFVGVGASRVRDLFNKAKKNAPCIIFIDEIDAVGRRRGSGLGGGHDEREQTLNQILVEMDGFEQGTNVIVMSATNRPDVLDPALLRPGRFDRQIFIDLPDRKAREAILASHLKNKPMANDVKLDKVAGKTAGMSGADLQNVANEAAILAARKNQKEIDREVLDAAFEKVAIGPERKSRVMSDQEKELTAYHEAGHALVGHVLPKADPIHKVTIVSRGSAGGITWSLPTEDKIYRTIEEFQDQLAQALGGRVAEEIVYGHGKITTGGGSDIQKATRLARDMVARYGMSEELPNIFLETEEHSLLLDREFAHAKSYSDATAELIDKEIQKMLAQAAQRAQEILAANRSMLDKLAKTLLKEETLEEEAVNKLLKDAKLPDAVAA